MNTAGRVHLRKTNNWRWYVQAIRFLHQVPSALAAVGLSISVINEGAPCCIGLSRNAAACFRMAALGVDGVRICAISEGICTFAV